MLCLYRHIGFQYQGRFTLEMNLMVVVALVTVLLFPARLDP